MAATLQDIGVYVTSGEKTVIMKVLAHFKDFQAIGIESYKLPNDSHWIETENILKTLEHEARLLSTHSRFAFDELPIAFYFSLAHCVYMHPKIVSLVDGSDALVILNLYKRIVVALNQ